jgi:hypothetical protein
MSESGRTSLFVALLLCPDCGKPVTGSLSTGKAGKKIGYHRCHRSSGPMNARAEVVEDAFVSLLNRLTPRAERMALIERIFRPAWTGHTEVAVTEVVTFRRGLIKLETQKLRILRQMADGFLSSKDFASLSKQAMIYPPSMSTWHLRRLPN